MDVLERWARSQVLRHWIDTPRMTIIRNDETIVP
jgi:hypothetical protein